MRGAALLVVALALLPPARADPDCAAVTEQPPNAAGAYLVLDPLRSGEQVWMEGNEYPGLQRQPCLAQDGTTTLGPDTQLVMVVKLA